ncbi:MAG: hypothetical protein ACK5Q5_21510 [Planctomycetaceae bacterium]
MRISPIGSRIGAFAYKLRKATGTIDRRSSPHNKRPITAPSEAEVATALCHSGEQGRVESIAHSASSA